MDLQGLSVTKLIKHYIPLAQNHDLVAFKCKILFWIGNWMETTMTLDTMPLPVLSNHFQLTDSQKHKDTQKQGMPFILRNTQITWYRHVWVKGISNRDLSLTVHHIQHEVSSSEAKNSEIGTSEESSWTEEALPPALLRMRRKVPTEQQSTGCEAVPREVPLGRGPG